MQSSLLTLDSFFFSVFKFLFCILMFFFPLQYLAILPYLLKGNSVVSEMVENSYMQIIVFKCVCWLGCFITASLRSVTQTGRNPPIMRRLRFDPWIRKIPPEKGKITHSSILSWRSLWTRSMAG